jgi:ABC-type amino acid transport system permease subunit
MSKLPAKIKEELEALVPPTLFFFVALHLVVFERVLMLRGTGITVGTSVSVTILALILGKAVLIADLLPFINRYPHKPLVYNVAWKTTIYVPIAALVHYLERLLDFRRESGGLAEADERMLAEVVWPHFWAIQIFLLVLILMYCTMRELVR